jgi:hypothetical protein
MIEVDQLMQIEERMRIHPLVQCHSDPENYLKTTLIKVRWYDRLVWTEEDIKSVEWYYHPPFLYLTLFHHDDIDLSTWLEVPFYVIEYILDQSYEGLSNTTSREMRHFYTALLKLLKLYERYYYNPTARSPSSLQSNEQLVSTVVYRNDGKINPKKRSQEDSASYTDLHDESSNSSRKTTIRNEPTRYENPTSENNISCSRNTQPNLRLFSDSAFGDYVELSTHGNHIAIIDNACSHHLTKSSSNVRQFVRQIASHPEGRSTVRFGSGDTTNIIGYGEHWFLGKTLVVPTLLFTTIISGGTLDRQGYTMVTTNGTIRVLGIDGRLAMLAYRNDNNLYVVKKIYPNNMLTTSPTTANSSNSALPICLVAVTPSHKYTQTSPVPTNDSSTNTDSTSNTNSVIADHDNLQAILPDMGNDLLSEPLLVGPFSSPV